MSRRTRSLLAPALAAVVISAAGPVPTASADPPRRTVTVESVVGGTFPACDGAEELRYVSGELVITETDVASASGGQVSRLRVQLKGAVAVGQESGTRYRDHYSVTTSSQGNATYFESEVFVDPQTGQRFFADGSHGVHGVIRARLSAPGSDAPTFTSVLRFHLRRVDGSFTIPPVDRVFASQECA